MQMGMEQGLENSRKEWLLKWMRVTICVLAPTDCKSSASGGSSVLVSLTSTRKAPFSELHVTSATWCHPWSSLKSGSYSLASRCQSSCHGYDVVKWNEMSENVKWVSALWFSRPGLLHNVGYRPFCQDATCLPSASHCDVNESSFECEHWSLRTW